MVDTIVETINGNSPIHSKSGLNAGGAIASKKEICKLAAAAVVHDCTEKRCRAGVWLEPGGAIRKIWDI